MVLRWGSVLFLVVMLAACGGGGGDVTSDSSSGNVSAGASGEGSEFDDVGLASRTAQSELYQEFDDLLFPVNYFEIDVLNPNRIVRKADSEEIVLPTDQPIEVGLRTFGYLPDETRFVVAEADRIVLNGQNDLRLSPIKGFEGRYKLEKQGGREQLAIYLKSTVPPHKKTPAILPGSDEIVIGKIHQAILGGIGGVVLESAFQADGFYNFHGGRKLGLGYQGQSWWLQSSKVAHAIGDIYMAQLGSRYSSSVGDVRLAVQSALLLHSSVNDLSVSLQYVPTRPDQLLNLSFGALYSMSSSFSPVALIRAEFSPKNGCEASCVLAANRYIAEFAINFSVSE